MVRDPVPSPKGLDPRKVGVPTQPDPGRNAGRIEKRKGRRSMYEYIQEGNTTFTEKAAEGEEIAEGEDREQKNKEEGKMLA